jgi:hypothetical protein
MIEILPKSVGWDGKGQFGEGIKWSSACSFPTPAHLINQIK